LLAFNKQLARIRARFLVTEHLVNGAYVFFLRQNKIGPTKADQEKNTSHN